MDQIVGTGRGGHAGPAPAASPVFCAAMQLSATAPDFGRLSASLQRILRTYGHRRLELEFRLGHRTGGRFVPGVSETAWTALKQTLDASGSFDVAATSTRELISDDGSGGKYVVPSEGEPHWMHKKRLLDVDVDTDSSPWCCRTSVSLEEVDPPGPQRPPPSRHRFERHKERWSYRYRCWSVDLTRVASNLPHQLDNDAMSYEVEIELADTSELFTRTRDAVLEWGWKLVTDMCGIMLRGTVGGHAHLKASAGAGLVPCVATAVAPMVVPMVDWTAASSSAGGGTAATTVGWPAP